jgi:5-methylcytosine-specific restriction endonuclease McrA
LCVPGASVEPTSKRADANKAQTSWCAGRASFRDSSAAERSAILTKTGGRCHICGGTIQGVWQADHVFPHSGGGGHAADNYLPAHALCNNYRWDYTSEEFQHILKLGVWLRTQIERRTAFGRAAAAAFLAYEHIRQGRRASVTSSSTSPRKNRNA